MQLNSSAISSFAPFATTTTPPIIIARRVKNCLIGLGSLVTYPTQTAHSFPARSTPYTNGSMSSGMDAKKSYASGD